MGLAIYNYAFRGDLTPIQVYSDFAEPEEIQPAYLFRQFSGMPVAEQKALQKTYGRVLDIGAGAGIHSQWLVQQGFSVTALEAASDACQVLYQTGASVICEDVFNYKPECRFDTILLLMNGGGLSGNLAGLDTLLTQFENWLTPGGQILLDSTDLRPLMGRALVQEREANHQAYYGTVTYQLQYANHIGTPFEWLFVDWPTLADHARAQGYTPECCFYGTDHHFLVHLS